MIPDIFPYKKKSATLALIILIAVLLKPQQVISQNNGFSKFADSLIKVRHIHFEAIDYAVYKNKYDTLKMQEFLQKSKEKNYLQGEVFANIMLGNQYRNKSLFEKSILYLNNALDIAKENNLIEFEVVSLNMLGVVDRRQDNIKSALDYHHEALSLAEKQIVQTEGLKKSIAVSHNSMGNIYLSIKQYDLALDEFNKSLAIEKELQNKLGLAINYHNIGAIYEANEELDRALTNYEISLQYNEEIDSDIGRIICKNSIGGIYVKQGKPEEALSVIMPTIALAEEKQDQFYIASAYLKLGWAQIQLNQLKEAQKNLEKGLDVAETYNLKASISEANFQLSHLNERKGNTKLALEQYQKAVDLDQTITSEKNSQYVNTLRFQYEAEKKNNQIQSLAIENEMVKLRLERNKKSIIFILIGLGLLAAGLLSFYRQKRLKSEKKILTLEQEMLRSQMNPHFIFNSLNSIKLYIINNEKENAVYYLNKFSKLIRKILVASTEKEISIGEELETMALYMNIENIRFSNEINFKITVDDDVNKETIKVPSLVLQPFLENALWHGLSSSTQKNKSIFLNVFKIKSNYITITITDNGIGRTASSDIKENKLLKRKSVGIELTKQRLENFSKNYTNTYKLSIEDLYENNNPSGTKITIEIPTKEIHKLKTA